MKRNLTILYGIIFALLVPVTLLAQGEIRTIDTGRTDNITGVHTNGNGHIAIVTQQGTHMHSNDGGKTWDYSQTTFGSSPTGLYGWGNSSGDGTNLVAVGKNGSYWKSTDGGSTWSANAFPTSEDINAVAGVQDPTQSDNAHLWAVGDGSKVFHSTDGGDIWNQQSTPYTGEDLYGVHFADQNNGVIGGQEGIIYRTTNGGTSWVYQVGAFNNPYYGAPLMLNQNFGFMGGQGGVLLQTTNGGSNWNNINSGTTQDINGIGFTGELDGVFIGDNGTLGTSTDGGSTWQQQDAGVTGNLNSLSTANGQFVAGGDGGTLLTNAPELPAVTITVTGQNDPPIIGLNEGDQETDPLTLDVNVPDNDPTVGWTASTDDPLATLIPDHGTGTGYFNVYVDPAQLDAPSETFTITVEPVNDGPQVDVPMTVKVVPPADDQPPFGAFSTPTDGSTVRSSVPVTGWALDDVQVEGVKVYRQGESSGSLVFLGDAQLVEGARPDVQTSYPDYPNNTKAGWGYMLLTNSLPNNGNGTFTLEAKATDAQGHEVSLGTKTITCDNENAVKPFGAIDTPTQGGVASGSRFINWGWALTPQPNSLYPCGASINVYVNGVSVGNPNYNVYRQDIASLFPGYANSQGAVGYFYLDTSAYENGVHNIHWCVTDDAGNSDGIGSRYFSIRNHEEGAPGGDSRGVRCSSPGGGVHLAKGKVETYSFHKDLTAPNPEIKSFRLINRGKKELNWVADVNQPWITLEPTSGTGEGWIFATFNPAGLAAGEHKATITVSEKDGLGAPYHVKAVLNVLAGDTEAPFGEFTFPDESRLTSGSINLSGWALDDIAVQSVKIYRVDGEENILVGDAHFVRGGRPDIESVYAHLPDADRAGWSYTFHTNTLADGEYKFNAVITDFEENEVTLEGNTFIVDNSTQTIPFGEIESPYEGEIIFGENYDVVGWVLAPAPNTIPTDGSTIRVMVDGVSAGNPIYNVNRTDIAALFPGLQNSNGAGATFALNTTSYSDGVHTISLFVTDDQGNLNEQLGARQVVFQNTSDITDVQEADELPTETDLFPAYPNPFNPSTNIRYSVSESSNVSLYVFDLLGRKVSTLLDNEHKAVGTYRFHWNGINDYGQRLSSGIYFLVMKANNFVKTEKMIMLK